MRPGRPAGRRPGSRRRDRRGAATGSRGPRHPPRGRRLGRGRRTVRRPADHPARSGPAGDRPGRGRGDPGAARARRGRGEDAMSAVEAGELACHRPAATETEASGEAPAAGAVDGDGRPVIAVVGRPNVGKSTFFARASGRYAEVANVPGTTVSMARRHVRLGGRAAVLVDLPGAFTLTDRSEGLPAFWELLLAARPDAIVVVVDAAARGIEMDLGRLSQLLAAPVHRTIGRQGVGVLAAVEDAVRLAGVRSSGDRAAVRRALPVPPYPAGVVPRVSALAGRLAGGDVPTDHLPPQLLSAGAPRPPL